MGKHIYKVGDSVLITLSMDLDPDDLPTQATELNGQIGTITHLMSSTDYEVETATGAKGTIYQDELTYADPSEDIVFDL